MYDYKTNSRFYRVGYAHDTKKQASDTDISDYALTIEAIIRGEGLYGDDVTIVKSVDEMPEDARQAYTTGIMNSGMLQLSMLFKPTNHIYIIVPSVKMSSEIVKLGKRKLILKTALAPIVVYKGLRHVIEDDKDDYEISMSTIFEAIGLKKY